MAKIVIFLILLFATFMAADECEQKGGYAYEILTIFCGIMTAISFLIAMFDMH